MELAKKSIMEEKGDSFCSYRNRYFKEDVLVIQKERPAIRHISPEEEEEFYGERHVQKEDGGFQAMLEDYKLGEEIKEAIDARISWQQGINMERSVKLTEGLESSVGGIHTFLVSFFKFYLGNARSIQIVTTSIFLNCSTCPTATASCTDSLPSGPTLPPLHSNSRS
jgi:hypothetical protein